eukprot:1533303-Prymnesium_polylepis.1
MRIEVTAERMKAASKNPTDSPAETRDPTGAPSTHSTAANGSSVPPPRVVAMSTPQTSTRLVPKSSLLVNLYPSARCIATSYLRGAMSAVSRCAMRTRCRAIRVGTARVATRSTLREVEGGLPEGCTSAAGRGARGGPPGCARPPSCTS